MPALFRQFVNLALNSFARVFVALVLLFVCVAAQPQPQYQFDSWTTDNGLPQNSVSSIIQTRDGYLWVATAGGLARFNGVDFTIFNRANTPGLENIRISRLYQDKAGNLWLVTDKSKLIKYQAGIFTTHSLPDGWQVVGLGADTDGNFQAVSREGVATWQQDHFVTRPVAELMPVPPAARWVLGNVLAKVDGDNLYLYSQGRLLTYPVTPDGLPTLKINAVFRDQYDIIWLNTQDQGLVRLQDGGFTTYPDISGPHSRSGFGFRERGNDTPQLEDSKHNIWFTGFDNYLGRWQAGDREPYDSPAWQVDVLTCLYQDHENNVWLGTAKGLFRAREPPITTYVEGENLPSDNIYTIYQDHTGALWFGSWGGGLTQYRDGVYTHYGRADGLASDFVTAISEDQEGYLLVATTGATEHGGGIRRLQEGRMTVFDAAQSLGSPLFGVGDMLDVPNLARKLATKTEPLSAYLSGKLTSDTQQLLAAAQSSGQFDGPLVNALVADFNILLEKPSLYDQKQFGDIALRAETRQLLAQQPTGDATLRLNRLLLEDAYQHEIATRNFFGEGTWVIYRDHVGRTWFGTPQGLVVKDKSGRYQRYTTASGLAGNDVTAISEDHNGVLWFGTRDGLSRWQGGGFTSYTAFDHIRVLYTDAQGVLWIGTYDGGLGRLQDGKVTRYTERDGLFNSGVFQIMEDSYGNFWMGCNLGIYRVKRQELEDFAAGRRNSVTSVAYGKTDGLLKVECNGGRQPSGWKTGDGKLWFPTAQGAAVLDPARVELGLNPLPPSVVIEKALLNNEAVPVGEALEITPDKNNSLEIRYQGLSLIHSEQVRFKYLLAGLDKNWVDVGHRRTAYYNRLPPGKYVFTVQAANSDGVWNERGASLRVVVRPAVWQTWWFWAGVVLLMLLLLLGGVALLYQRRLAQEANYAVRLKKAQEQERQDIAQNMHDGLGQLLYLIIGYAKDGARAAKKHKRSTHYFAEISRQSEKVTEEIDRLIERQRLRPQEIDRVGLTVTLRKLLQEADGVAGLTIASDIEPIDDAFDAAGRIELRYIVQESLQNIWKHSQASAAKFAIKHEGNSVRVSIEDNGRGFETGALTQGQRAGWGLDGIKKRTRLLGGEVELSSAPGEGTRITITIPFPEKK